MSLINQALKQEQRRRSPELAAAASLRMGRASHGRGGNDKALTLVVGFAVVGLILAGVAAAFIYFGSRFIDSIEFADKGAPPAEQEAPAAPAAQAAPTAAASESAAPEPAPAASLGGLTAADLDKLRHLLHAAQPEALAAAGGAEARAPGSSPVENPDLRAANQAIVDRLQIQGFRKAGQSSRAFLNGKLYKIGDVVDQASGLFIAGYTDSTLVFEDPLGYRYERVL